MKKIKRNIIISFLLVIIIITIGVIMAVYFFYHTHHVENDQKIKDNQAKIVVITKPNINFQKQPVLAQINQTFNQLIAKNNQQNFSPNQQLTLNFQSFQSEITKLDVQNQVAIDIFTKKWLPIVNQHINDLHVLRNHYRQNKNSGVKWYYWINLWFHSGLTIVSLFQTIFYSISQPKETRTRFFCGMFLLLLTMNFFYWFNLLNSYVHIITKTIIILGLCSCCYFSFIRQLLKDKLSKEMINNFNSLFSWKQNKQIFFTFFLNEWNG